MFKIEMKINGKPIDAYNVRDALEKATIKAIREDLTRKVGHLRCSTHQRGATITMSGAQLDKLDASVSGCCEEFMAEVRKSLG